MKKNLIFKLRNINLKDKKKNIILNLPNGFLIKKKFNSEFFYSERWKHTNKIIKDFEYLNDFYEKKLTYLSKFLNTYHQVNYNKRYWRIVIGTWLWKFLNLVFERWNTLKEVSKKYKEISVEISKYKQEDFIPYGIEDFVYFTQSDTWNNYIYTEIINNFKFHSISKKVISKIILNEDISEIKKRLILNNSNYKSKIFNLVQKGLLEYNLNQDYFVFDTTLSNLEEIKINFSLNKKVFLFKSIKFDRLLPYLTSEKINLSNKRYNNRKIKENNLEDLLFKLIKENIPKLYLEHFNLTNKVVTKFKLPKKPKIIFSTLGINRSTLMDIYIANKITSGAKLVLAQHGGNYGQHRAHWGTIHEHKIANNFISWGSKFENKTKPLGIIKKIDEIKFNKKNNLILLEFRTRNLYSQTIKIDGGAINNKLYMENLIKFFNNLKNTEILDKLKIKLHHKDFSTGEKEFLQQSNQKLQFTDNTKNTKSFYKKSKIVIHTYPSTGHLECLASNIPMLIYIQPDINLLEPKTKKYFKEFRKLGIFHNSPVSLSNMLKRIHKDPSKWWFSEKIQTIRKKYVNEFAIVNKNLVDDIIKTLKEI
tara:strand:+ start:4227 stop:5999 length:1773 start_codon:yes stop_codon:yes gene_type:complete